MSKAPETIYLQACDEDDCADPFDSNHEITWCVDPINERDQKYVRGDIAYGYACEVERLRSVLKQIARNADILTTKEIEHIARDALTKEG